MKIKTSKLTSPALDWALLGCLCAKYQPEDDVMKKLQKLGIPPVVKSNIEAVEG